VKILTNIQFIVKFSYIHLPMWWPGKIIIPLQPMLVIKGDHNGYPVPGCVAGSPCPGGYKYGVLALLVGGGVTDQQPVTVKKPTVRKPKLWPQNSQTEWNWPGSGEGFNEVWTATLNVHALYRMGAMIELVKEWISMR
jgi:hypothetical protein